MKNTARYPSRGARDIRQVATMNTKSEETPQFDAIVVGSGAGGATVARELAKQQRKVLILERGAQSVLKESFLGLASIADEVPVGDGVKAMRGLTAGGSTGLYFAVADTPPLEIFRNLGIDLSTDLESALAELPVSEIPDRLLGEQAIRIRDSARTLGYSWQKNRMLIDFSRCQSGYSYDAKWRARSYVDEAVRDGATLLQRATVRNILFDQNRAIGVEFAVPRKWKGVEVRRAFARKIILAAGAMATPAILRDSGVTNIGRDGFFCDPSFAMFGFVPRLRGTETFMGSMSTSSDEFALADASVSRLFHKLLMLANFKLSKLFSYAACVGVGVKIKDGMAGVMRADGSYYKSFSSDEHRRLKKGEQAAREILHNAGARHVFNSGLGSVHVGGLVRIRDHVDETLQTQFDHLHVCDGSLIPENVRIAPTLSLICLGKYLARHLLPAL
jgi:hypothetical protein